MTYTTSFELVSVFLSLASLVHVWARLMIISFKHGSLCCAVNNCRRRIRRADYLLVLPRMSCVQAAIQIDLDSDSLL